MSFDACEKLVKAGDHDRFLSAQSAPTEARKALMAIYALNLETARAPWASPEPLVAQMRLQWWAGEIEKIYQGKRVTTHAILPALREVIFDYNLPQRYFEALVEARMKDVYADPPENRTEFDSYIGATSGSIMAMAAKTLGAPETAMEPIAEFAYGAGVANLLRAAPALVARGRQPLIEPVGEIVKSACQSLAKARAQRSAIPSSVAPALLAGWRADVALAMARKRPESIMAGLLEESLAHKMATLRWRKLTGRW